MIAEAKRAVQESKLAIMARDRSLARGLILDELCPDCRKAAGLRGVSSEEAAANALRDARPGYG